MSFWQLIYAKHYNGNVCDTPGKPDGRCGIRFPKTVSRVGSNRE
jgi:hypothetical protein